MNNALRAMIARMDTVDALVEVHDARIALTGRCVSFARHMLPRAPHVLCMNKVDMIDAGHVHRVEEHMRRRGQQEQLVWSSLKTQTIDSVDRVMAAVFDALRWVMQR